MLESKAAIARKAARLKRFKQVQGKEHRAYTGPSRTIMATGVFLLALAVGGLLPKRGTEIETPKEVTPQLNYLFGEPVKESSENLVPQEVHDSRQALWDVELRKYLRLKSEYAEHYVAAAAAKVEKRLKAAEHIARVTARTRPKLADGSFIVPQTPADGSKSDTEVIWIRDDEERSSTIRKPKK